LASNPIQVMKSLEEVSSRHVFVRSFSFDKPTLLRRHFCCKISNQLHASVP